MIKKQNIRNKNYFKNIKNRLKIFYVLKQTFVLQNIREQFSKTVL